MQGRLRHAASYKCCSVSENACAKVSFMLTRSLFTLVLLSACSANPGQAVLSQPASAHATPTDVASDARRAPLDLARQAAKRGVLDVASLYYAQVLEGSPTAEVRIEQLRTLAQAYAPEATKLLQSARSELDASAVRSIERLISATPSEAPPSAWESPTGRRGMDSGREHLHHNVDDNPCPCSWCWSSGKGEGVPWRIS